MALQSNVRSTGAFVVFNNSCMQEIKPTTQVTTETTVKKAPKSQLEEVDIGAQFLKGRLALIQEKDFVPLFVFTFLCIA